MSDFCVFAPTHASLCDGVMPTSSEAVQTELPVIEPLHSQKFDASLATPISENAALGAALIKIAHDFESSAIGVSDLLEPSTPLVTTAPVESSAQVEPVPSVTVTISETPAVFAKSSTPVVTAVSDAPSAPAEPTLSATPTVSETPALLTKPSTPVVTSASVAPSAPAEMTPFATPTVPEMPTALVRPSIPIVKAVSVPSVPVVTAELLAQGEMAAGPVLQPELVVVENRGTTVLESAVKAAPVEAKPVQPEKTAAETASVETLKIATEKTVPVEIRKSADTVKVVSTAQSGQRDKAEPSDVVLQVAEVPVLLVVDNVSISDPVISADGAKAVESVSSVSGASASEAVLAAANAVADTLLVSPGLMRGEGEILVRLKPTVLDGTEVRITVTGREISVVFSPATAVAANLLSEHVSELEAHLTKAVIGFEMTVAVQDVAVAATVARLPNAARMRWSKRT